MSYLNLKRNMVNSILRRAHHLIAINQKVQGNNQSQQPKICLLLQKSQQRKLKDIKRKIPRVNNNGIRLLPLRIVNLRFLLMMRYPQFLHLKFLAVISLKLIMTSNNLSKKLHNLNLNKKERLSRKTMIGLMSCRIKSTIFNRVRWDHSSKNS